MTSGYECPRCERPYMMQEDARSRNFLCGNIECGASLSFEKYKAVAETLLERPLRPSTDRPPSMECPLPKTMVNDLLALLYSKKMEMEKVREELSGKELTAELIRGLGDRRGIARLLF